MNAKQLYTLMVDSRAISHNVDALRGEMHLHKKTPAIEFVDEGTHQTEWINPKDGDVYRAKASLEQALSDEGHANASELANKIKFFLGGENAVTVDEIIDKASMVHAGGANSPLAMKRMRTQMAVAEKIPEQLMLSLKDKPSIGR